MAKASFPKPSSKTGYGSRNRSSRQSVTRRMSRNLRRNAGGKINFAKETTPAAPIFDPHDPYEDDTHDPTAIDPLFQKGGRVRRQKGGRVGRTRRNFSRRK